MPVNTVDYLSERRLALPSFPWDFSRGARCHSAMLRATLYSGQRTRRANFRECSYMALVTIILLQLSRRTFQATESFVYQQKSPIKLLIFKTCKTLSIVIRVGILCISRVFWRIFTYPLYDYRPLTLFTPCGAHGFSSDPQPPPLSLAVLLATFQVMLILLISSMTGALPPCLPQAVFLSLSLWVPLKYIAFDITYFFPQCVTNQLPFTFAICSWLALAHRSQFGTLSYHSTLRIYWRHLLIKVFITLELL